MAYLEIYDTIWSFLEEKEVLNEVIEFAQEEIPIVLEDKSEFLVKDIVLEHTLFNYHLGEELLIEYVNNNCFFDTEDSEMFQLLQQSERKTYTFQKKRSLEERDSHGNRLNEHFFKDIESDEIKVVLSSAKLESFNTVNLRLIRNPAYKEKRYNIIGGFFDESKREEIKSIQKQKEMIKIMEENQKRVNCLAELAITFSGEEIENYTSETSHFIQEDKKLIRLFKEFYEKTGIEFFTFSKEIFERANSKEFTSKGKIYGESLKKISEVIFNTNYSLDIDFFAYENLYIAFLGFVTNDMGLFEEGINMMKKSAREDFDNWKSSLKSQTREGLFKFHIKNMKEKIEEIQDENVRKEFQQIYEYASKCTTTDINEFMEYLKKFIELEIRYTKEENEKALLEISLEGFNHEFYKQIPYKEQIEKELSEFNFSEENFLEHIGENTDEMRDLVYILYAGYKYTKREFSAAYSLLTGIKYFPENCFPIVFFMGKLYNIFKSKKYKKFFRVAKRIDREKYKTELEEFLKIQNEVNL